MRALWSPATCSGSPKRKGESRKILRFYKMSALHGEARTTVVALTHFRPRKKGRSMLPSGPIDP